MSKSKFVILGGGMVAGYAAKQLVELGLQPGELTILSADTSIPYERPPLSKGFLAGKDTEESIRISPEEFYRKHEIEVKLNCEISGVDPKRKQLVLKSGGEFGFDKLVVATGAKPRMLEIALPRRLGTHSTRDRHREARGRDRRRVHRNGSNGGAGAEGHRGDDGCE